MSERGIEFKDIRVGDTIRREWVHREVKWMSEGEVTAVHADDLYLEVGNGGPWGTGPANYTYILLDRPKPPLPTEPGSVIIATKVRGVEGEWRLMRDAWGEWISPEQILDTLFHRDGDVQEWRPTEVFEVQP